MLSSIVRSFKSKLKLNYHSIRNFGRENEVWVEYQSNTRYMYYVSNYGDVARKRNNSTKEDLDKLKLTTNKYGYLKAMINGKCKNVHEIVVDLFINDNQKPSEPYKVIHIDGNIRNNYVFNLQCVVVPVSTNTHDIDQLIVDNREPVKIYKRKGLQFESAQLPIGDYIFIKDSMVMNMIIERKTYEDMISSLFDGRYRKQKTHYITSNFSNIVYIIEKSVITNWATENIPEYEYAVERIKSEMEQLKEHGINVIETGSICETMNVLKDIQINAKDYLKINDEPIEYKQWKQFIRKKLSLTQKIFKNTGISYEKSCLLASLFDDYDAILQFLCAELNKIAKQKNTDITFTKTDIQKLK